MSINVLKVLLWLLLSLPVLVIGGYIFCRTLKEANKAEKANDINE